MGIPYDDAAGGTSEPCRPWGRDGDHLLMLTRRHDGMPKGVCGAGRPVPHLSPSLTPAFREDPIAYDLVEA